MTIATELNRIIVAKSNLATAIAAKGVAVPGGTLIDGYASLVNQITASGTSPVTLAAGNEQISVTQPSGQTRRLFIQPSATNPAGPWDSVTGEVPFTITGLMNGIEYRVHDGGAAQLVTPVDEDVPAVRATWTVNMQAGADADRDVDAMIGRWLTIGMDESSVSTTQSHRTWDPTYGATEFGTINSNYTGFLMARKNGTRPMKDAVLNLSRFIGAGEIVVRYWQGVWHSGSAHSNTTGTWTARESVRSEIRSVDASNVDANSVLHTPSSVVFHSLSGYPSSGDQTSPAVYVTESAPFAVSAALPFLRMRCQVHTSAGLSGGGHPNFMGFQVQAVS